MKNFIIPIYLHKIGIKVVLLSSFFLYASINYTKAQALSISASVVNGTCSNNGQLNVSASGGTAPYQYRLTDGPSGLLYPTSYQSGTNYASLKAGTYTIEVKDAANNIATITKTITTSYVSLNITSVNATANHCSGASDGTVKITATAGRTPYTYALLSGTTVINGPQASNTFTGIADGTYTAQVTDACGEIRTYSVIIPLLNWTFNDLVKTQDNNFFGAGGGSSTPPAPFDSTVNLGSGVGPLLFTCDSISARFNNIMVQNSSGAAPRRIWVKDLNTGTIIFDQTYTPNSSFRQASATVKMKINTGYRIYYSDLCDNLDSTDRNYSTQTSYSINGGPLRLCNGYKMSLHWSNDYNTMNKYSCPKDTITIIGSTLIGDTTVGKFTIHDKLAGNTWNGSIEGITPGNTYTIRVNTCCSTYVTSQFIGGTLADASFLILRDQACKLNTAAFVINSNYLPVSPGNLLYTIKSGPATFTDVKGNVFSITYPIKDSTPINSTVNNIYIRNFPEGTYAIDVRDQCGAVQTLNTTVTSADVAKITANIVANPQCSGASSITFSGSYQHVAGNIALYKKNGDSYSLVGSSATFSSTAQIPASYTFTGLADGDYRVILNKIGGSGSAYGVHAPVDGCDTLFTQDVNLTYQLPSFSSATHGYVCTPGSNDGLVVVKGLNGARPYTFQRLSIPSNTVINTQTDSVFTGLARGAYRFRIIDNCGNGIINDVAIDTLSRPAIGSEGTFCGGTEAMLYSPALAPEATFLWTGPDDFSSVNDSVFFNPVTASNIGKYTLNQTLLGCTNKETSITINNCEAVPVNIVRLSGNATNDCGTIKLAWQTATELNVKEFQVQQSDDQVNFKTVSAKPASNILSGSSYVITAKQNDKNAFYRLAMIDLNGRESYSNIIKVTENCKGAADYIMMYPNPVSSTGKIFAEISSSKKTAASIILHAQDGKRVLTQKIELAEGINRIEINSRRIMPGTYSVTLVNKNSSNTAEAKIVIY